MTNQLHQFDFQSNIIRVEVDGDGNPWFLAKDICNVLGYANHNDAIKNHCQAKGVAKRYPLQTSGGVQYPAFINEGNLYRLIIKSNKPEAEPFESWVCDEVLPSIRKHGYYVNPNAAQKPQSDLFDDMPNELPPFQRVKPSLLIKLGKMSKSLAQAYLIECGVTPDYVQQQLTMMGDAAPMLGIAQRDTVETLVLQFIEDWKAQAIAAPVIHCAGTQALRLFRYWAENKGHSLHTGENKIMAALYRAPGFYNKRARYENHRHSRAKHILMVEGLERPVNMNNTEWLFECMQLMEAALNKLEGG